MIIKKRSIPINILFAILLFIICLPTLSDISFVTFVLKHIDEAISLVMLGYIILNYRIAFRKEGRIIVTWLIILCIGLFSNFVFGYQPLYVGVTDAIIFFDRFLIGYIAVKIYCVKHNRLISELIYHTAQFITVLLFIFTVHDMILAPLFPLGEYRYFMNSIQLMFPHPTFLAIASSTLLIYWGYMKKHHNTMYLMLMSSFICFCTLRFKAIGFVCLYWLVYFFLFVLKRKNMTMIVLVGMFVVTLIAWDQIVVTFFAVGRFSPRSILLKDSISLLFEHFPLGTGFGTFGTTMARDYYSPLYSSLGYNYYDGMSATDTRYLSDSFWPGVFAQLGLIGSVQFVYLIYLFLKKTMQAYKNNKYSGFSMFMVMAYLLITSLAEAAFFNPAVLLMMMLFAVFEMGL